MIRHDWIFTIFYFTSSLTAYSIFIYHELRFKDLTYYLEHVEFHYDFSFSRYKLNRTIFCVFLPMAMLIIAWSIVEKFNSNKFLMRFGWCVF